MTTDSIDLCVPANARANARGPRWENPPRQDPPCRVLHFAPWPSSNQSLHGHADIEFAGGWRIGAIPIFRRADGSLTAGVPSVPELDSEGRVRLDNDGKRRFAHSDARHRWRRMIAAALADAGIRGLVGEDVP
jgi:hypothetical protein